MSQGSIEAVRIGVLCNRQAMEARQRRVNLLQDTGMLNRELGHVDVTGRVQADDVRGFLRSEGLLDPVKADDEVKTDEESVESWLEGDSTVKRVDPLVCPRHHEPAAKGTTGRAKIMKTERTDYILDPAFCSTGLRHPPPRLASC